VLRMEQIAGPYGAERRRVRIIKMRGVPFRGGFHDFIIQRGGVKIFPRLIAALHHREFDDTGPATSGINELDTMLGGGLDRGTSTLLMGPSGSGKSSMSLSYMKAAMSRGEHVGLITFDETERILLKRSAGLGVDLAPAIAAGDIRLAQIDPAELSPGELTGLVREMVERDGARMIVIDSLTGYLNSIPEEQYLLLQLHELLTYLNQQGVVTILILAQHGLVGHMATPVDMTYLSDTVVLLRFFESGGKIRRAVSVMKKRTGAHEDSIREYRIDRRGVRVGEPLENFHGVLTGVPRFQGNAEKLLKDRDGG
jgi:circadian clock protein KaiC